MFVVDGKTDVLKKDVFITDLEMVEKHQYNRYMLTTTFLIEEF